MIPSAALAALEEEVARQYQVLPLRLVDQQLYVAVGDSGSTDLDQVAMFTDYHLVSYLVPPDLLAQVIEEAYSAKRRGAPEWRGPKATPKRVSTILPAAQPAARKPGDPPNIPEPQFGKAAPGSAPKPKRATLRGHTILVVDDEPGIRAIVGEALRQRSYSMVEAGDGAEALRMVEKGGLNAVLLDANLPKVHGFDVATQLHDHHPTLPVVMMTGMYKGWRMAEDAREAHGVAAWVEKPFDVFELVSLLETVIEGGDAWAVRDVPPTDGPAARFYQEGAAAFQQGDIDTAIQFLNGAVEQAPMNAVLREQLGLLYAQRGHEFRAISQLEACLDLSGRRYSALRNLAILYQRRGYRRKAAEIWQRALACAPDSKAQDDIKRLLVGLI